MREGPQLRIKKEIPACAGMTKRNRRGDDKSWTLDFVQGEDGDVGCVAEVCAFGKDAVGAVHVGGREAQGLPFCQLVVGAVRIRPQLGGLHGDIRVHLA